MCTCRIFYLFYFIYFIYFILFYLFIIIIIIYFISNQPSPKQQVSPLMKVKPPHQQRDVSSSLKTQLSTSSRASSVATSVGMGGERGVATIFSPSQSQDSFVESGLSPDTSDTGDHSAESIETEPREVDIKKGTAHLGKNYIHVHVHVQYNLLLLVTLKDTSIMRTGSISPNTIVMCINEPLT